MQYQRTLKKQEGLIRDPKSSIKVILWESYVDTLTLNSTYIFTNLKMKLSKNKNERHLNTAKDVSFYAKKTAPFTQPLIDVNRELASMVTSTINGKIIGFLEINTGVCRGLYQYVHIPLCSPRWNDLSWFTIFALSKVFAVFIWNNFFPPWNAANWVEHCRLTLYHQQIQELITHMKLDLNLKSVSKTDMTLEICKPSHQHNLWFAFKQSTSNQLISITILDIL